MVDAVPTARRLARNVGAMDAIVNNITSEEARYRYFIRPGKTPLRYRYGEADACCPLSMQPAYSGWAAGNVVVVAAYATTDCSSWCYLQCEQFVRGEELSGSCPSRTQ